MTAPDSVCLFAEALQAELETIFAPSRNTFRVNSLSGGDSRRLSQTGITEFVSTIDRTSSSSVGVGGVATPDDNAADSSQAISSMDDDATAESDAVSDSLLSQTFPEEVSDCEDVAMTGPTQAEEAAFEAWLESGDGGSESKGRSRDDSEYCEVTAPVGKRRRIVHDSSSDSDMEPETEAGEDEEWDVDRCNRDLSQSAMKGTTKRPDTRSSMQQFPGIILLSDDDAEDIRASSAAVSVTGEKTSQSSCTVEQPHWTFDPVIALRRYRFDNFIGPIASDDGLKSVSSAEMATKEMCSLDNISDAAKSEAALTRIIRKEVMNDE